VQTDNLSRGGKNIFPVDSRAVTFGPLVEVRLREGKTLGTDEAEVSGNELHSEQKKEFGLGLHWLYLKFLYYICKKCEVLL
jgi:hypothetical protein